MIIPEHEIERFGNKHIRDLYMGHAVMIAVKLPEKLVVMLKAMHPILPKLTAEKRQDLHPQWTQLIGARRITLRPKNVFGK